MNTIAGGPPGPVPSLHARRRRKAAALRTIERRVIDHAPDGNRTVTADCYTRHVSRIGQVEIPCNLSRHPCVLPPESDHPRLLLEVADARLHPVDSDDPDLRIWLRRPSRHEGRPRRDDSPRRRHGRTHYANSRCEPCLVRRYARADHGGGQSSAGMSQDVTGPVKTERAGIHPPPTSPPARGAPSGRTPRE